MEGVSIRVSNPIDIAVVRYLIRHNQAKISRMYEDLSSAKSITCGYAAFRGRVYTLRETGVLITAQGNRTLYQLDPEKQIHSETTNDAQVERKIVSINAPKGSTIYTLDLLKTALSVILKNEQQKLLLLKHLVEHELVHSLLEYLEFQTLFKGLIMSDFEETKVNVERNPIGPDLVFLSGRYDKKTHEFDTTGVILALLESKRFQVDGVILTPDRIIDLQDGVLRISYDNTTSQTLLEELCDKKLFESILFTTRKTNLGPGPQNWVELPRSRTVIVYSAQMKDLMHEFSDYPKVMEQEIFENNPNVKKLLDEESTSHKTEQGEVQREEG